MHASWQSIIQTRLIKHWWPCFALVLMKLGKLYFGCQSFFSFFFRVHLPRRRNTQQGRHIVTRLSASLLTPWLFPDKCSCPLDSTSLSSRVMANYQEAVCWKDAARNYIWLQTALRSKHVLSNKLPSQMKYIWRKPNCFLSIKWQLRNARVMSEMRTGILCVLF